MKDRTGLEPLRALPPEAPLAMPRAPLHRRRARRREHAGWAATVGIALARLYVLATTLLLGGYGTYEMYRVLATVGPTGVQWLFLVVFSINFFWISFALSQASLGFVRELFGWLPNRRRTARAAPGRTAILVPVYNEDPLRVAGAMRTMIDELAEQAPGGFAVFILSDTNQPHAWVREEQVFRDLWQDAPSACPVYYRHRARNVEKKAGNIADWVQRFGAHYEGMVVFDADSLMSADTLITLASRLAADPGLGLIQTLPGLVRGRTLYGRLQQFAAACYGPLYGRGLATWHGYSSNFWGHNAIVRVRAFAEACHLPKLSGKPPFGGHILSHDFAEAALLRRAGWGVRLDADLVGSYEEAPPSLIDTMVRDRRWCQGNLQHIRLVFARGLRLPSRLHLLSGIMSYLSSVLWMLLVLVGLALAVQAVLIKPEYFAEPSLFPTWPIFDTERALALLGLSMAVVLGPKVLGLLRGLLLPRAFVGFGGPVLLTVNVLLETLLSALYAPVMMVAQNLIVLQVVTGRDSGWQPQRRDSGAEPWAVVWRAHGLHVVMGAVLAGVAWYLNFDLFLWLLPLTVGLVLSPLLSRISSSARLGRLLRRLALLRTPEERRPPALLRALQEQLDQQPEPADAQPLLVLAGHPALRRWHAAQLQEASPAAVSAIDVNHLVAAAKARHTAQDLDALCGWLTPQEQLALLNDRDYLLALDEASDPALVVAEAR